MESILENLINHITANMPELKVVDEDYGQLEALNQESTDQYPLTFPAVLIDAPTTAWSNIGGISQKGTVTVRIRLILDCYDDTHGTSGTTYLMAQREAKRRELHKLLQGHRIDGDDLIRTESRFFTVAHGIKVYESTYNLTVTEVIKPETVTAQVKPKISVKVMK